MKTMMILPAGSSMFAVTFIWSPSLFARPLGNVAGNKPLLTVAFPESPQSWKWLKPGKRNTCDSSRPLLKGWALYHHINVNDDRTSALADLKKFLDLYYSANYSKERLQAWLAMGRHAIASTTSSNSRPRAAGALPSEFQPWVIP